MVYVPVINVAQTEIRGSIYGQDVENTLYWSHIGGAIDTAAIQGLATAIEQWWYTSGQTKLPQAYQYREVLATDLTTATAPTATADAEGGFVGTYPTDANTMPGNCTICVTFRTNGRGRSSRGRNYWPGLPRNTVVGNSVNVAYTGQIESMYQNLLPNGLNPPPGWQWVIVSRWLNKVQRPVGAILPVTDVVFANQYVDSMRRRLPGRGN